MIAATIVARNYRAQARVLAASFVAHHPGVRFVVLLVDGEDTDRDTIDHADVLLPADLPFAPGEFEEMAGTYSVMELATAVKPMLLSHLLEEQASEGRDGVDAAVAYLDPDIEVYAPFPEVFEAAAAVGIALTPHVLSPMPRDGFDPDEQYLMHAGLFNLGFIAVGALARPFLAWWHERLRRDAVVDLSSALFTDQRWIDWVPSLFDVTVLRDRGLNAAYWNLHERPIGRGDDGVITVGGDPLRFFHFSGHDPDRPWELSKHVTRRPRVTLLDSPELAELCAGYVTRLRAAGIDDERATPYGLSVCAVGTVLTPLVRSVYREGLHGDEPVPGPFATDGGAAFTSWIDERVLGPASAQVSRWEAALWRSRPDLVAAFPDLFGVDARLFRTWLENDAGASEARDALGLAPRAATEALAPRTWPKLDNGWNVVGYFAGELGVGEAARRLNAAMEAAGIATNLVAVTASGSRAEHDPRRRIGEELRYRDSIYCVNADELARTIRTVEGSDAIERPPGDRGRRIGLWFWEVDRFPARWQSAFDLLDEVWCTSEFVATTLRQTSPIPVHIVPLPVLPPSAPTPFGRAQLGLPEGFAFLFSFDFHSVVDRKNPLGVIEAFRSAFHPGSGAHLVVKSINGDHHRSALDRLRFAALDRPDISIRDGYLRAHEMQALIEHCDAFVSLHRSEGFGLHLAAAMAAGRPVVATGYSGNLAFMDATTAHLVPYELTAVGPGNDPYPPDARWAAPDVTVAAELLRALVDDRDGASALGERGRLAVLRRLSLDGAAQAVRQRLAPDLPSLRRVVPRDPGGEVAA